MSNNAHHGCSKNQGQCPQAVPHPQLRYLQVGAPQSGAEGEGKAIHLQLSPATRFPPRSARPDRSRRAEDWLLPAPIGRERL